MSTQVSMTLLQTLLQWGWTILISMAQVTTKSPRDVRSLCCHLKSCWCPCCFYPLLMFLTCTSTRGHADICCLWCHLKSLLFSTFLLWLGDVWFHWPVTLLKGKWISFVWRVTWNHVAVRGPYCPFRLCWYAWMTIIVTWGHVDDCCICCQWGLVDVHGPYYH